MRSFQPLRRMALAAGIAGLCLLAPAPAFGCGGFFCMSQPMDQSGERIIFVQDPDIVTAHVLINYQGSARQFSWVVPTPTEPKLGVGSEALFRALDTATAPRFSLEIKDVGDCYWPPSRAEEKMEDRVYSAPAASGVQVVSQEQVGPYDTAVIRSDDPDALRRWLRTNGYVLPPKLDPLLDPYVAGGYYFVALKLQQDREAGDLQPITMRYHATKPGIPIRLTGVAATPNMDVFVWVLGDDRAVPENYRHAEINETQIDWLGGGYNYKQVVTRAVDEAGGQAFVTDFAGDTKGVDLTPFRGEHWNLARLATLTDPVEFLRAIQDDGYFQRGSAQALAFVRRYVPIPKSMKDVWEPGFYSNPEQYRQQLRREGVTVDAAKAAKELEETVVKPYREIGATFERHHYLTRMYTTMSPEEMTQDPTFRFNPYLEKVDNVHTATGERDCRFHKDGATAPIHVTLKDGTRFTIYPDQRPRPYGMMPRPVDDGGPAFSPSVPGSPPVMPAALRIEQMSPMGPPSVIQDNRGAIAAALASDPHDQTPNHAGMGCSRSQDIPGTNPAPAPQKGAGETATYALLLLGWRWHTRRRRR